jgi:hypothetical protein
MRLRSVVAALKRWRRGPHIQDSGFRVIQLDGRDVVVLTFEGRLSMRQAERLQEVWSEIFVGLGDDEVKLLILDGGPRLTVLRRRIREATGTDAMLTTEFRKPK